MRPPLPVLAAALLLTGAFVAAQTDAPGIEPKPASPAIAAVEPPASAASGAAAVALQPSLSLTPLPTGEAAHLPMILRAQRIRSQPDIETVAEGNAEFRRGGLVISADQMAYENPLDLASAQGNVRVTRDGAIYTGPELQLRVQRFEGFFREPTFEFTQLGSGGRAERMDFIDSARARAIRAEYTSCPREGPAPPAWVLKADEVDLDLEANEGVAKGAVLRFLDVPILALPSFTFPLSDTRKSGWLPPTISTDSRSGIELAVPYYWNIAPNRDATLTPRLLSRRGVALDGEFRYLQPRDIGTVQLNWLPSDRVENRSRAAWQWTHQGELGTDSGHATLYSLNVVRVTDDAWWKDFPDSNRSLTPRLLPLRATVEQPFAVPGLAGAEAAAYARVVQWQVLQGSDQIVVAPYERTPQVGLRVAGGAAGWFYEGQTEFNRFSLPSGEQARAGREGGDRLHLLASLSRPIREPGWWLLPRLRLNAAAYDSVVQDPTLMPETGSNAAPPGPRSASRAIPTFSVETGATFERSGSIFGRAFEQTLEPRLLYVRTPFHDQSQLPNYDAAGKDFDFSSIYSDNAFSGVDRVADANQLTAGFTTRFVDPASGAEAMRLALVQRYLFETQQIAARADGTPGGAPLEQRFSDVLLLASTSVVPRWNLDSSVQYSPDLKRAVRSIIGLRYSPGPFRTVSATYRLARGFSEQMELAWQWPLWGPPGPRVRGNGAVGDSGGNNDCGGTWYAVGRVNYSLKDSRITDSVLGAEYDAGCWIGRVVAERHSIGTSEATTRLMLQLELVGLSRLGSNPLKVLKDNIPGYQLLRDDRTTVSPFDVR